MHSTWAPASIHKHTLIHHKVLVLHSKTRLDSGLTISLLARSRPRRAMAFRITFSLINDTASWRNIFGKKRNEPCYQSGVSAMCLIDHPNASQRHVSVNVHHLTMRSDLLKGAWGKIKSEIRIKHNAKEGHRWLFIQHVEIAWQFFRLLITFRAGIVFNRSAVSILHVNISLRWEGKIAMFRKGLFKNQWQPLCRGQTFPQHTSWEWRQETIKWISTEKD